MKIFVVFSGPSNRDNSDAGSGLRGCLPDRAEGQTRWPSDTFAVRQSAGHSDLIHDQCETGQIAFPGNESPKQSPQQRYEQPLPDQHKSAAKESLKIHHESIHKRQLEQPRDATKERLPRTESQKIIQHKLAPSETRSSFVRQLEIGEQR